MPRSHTLKPIDEFSDVIFNVIIITTLLLLLHRPKESNEKKSMHKSTEWREEKKTLHTSVVLIIFFATRFVCHELLFACSVHKHTHTHARAHTLRSYTRVLTFTKRQIHVWLHEYHKPYSLNMSFRILEILMWSTRECETHKHQALHCNVELLRSHFLGKVKCHLHSMLYIIYS